MSKRLFRRGNSSIWHAWCYTADGRRITFSTRQTDEKAARLVLRQREREAATTSRISARSAHSVEDALRYLVEEAKSKDWSSATLEMFAEKGGHLLRVLGSLKLSQLAKPDVARYVDVRLGEGAARSTVAKELSTLRAALREAERLGWIDFDPRSVIPPFGAKYVPRTRWLTPDEFRAIQQQLAPTRQAWMSVAVYAGLRSSEVENLAWEDVEGDWIRLRGTKTSGSRRAIPIVQPLRELLEKVPMVNRTGKIVEPWPNVRRGLRDVCDRLGFDRVSPNDLRRTFASWMKQRGVDSAAVAKLLGHTTTRMVDLVYGRLHDEVLVSAMKQLEVRAASSDDCSKYAAAEGGLPGRMRQPEPLAARPPKSKKARNSGPSQAASGAPQAARFANALGERNRTGSDVRTVRRGRSQCDSENFGRARRDRLADSS